VSLAPPCELSSRDIGSNIPFGLSGRGCFTMDDRAVSWISVSDVPSFRIKQEHYTLTVSTINT
jgi:hypothetical protein